MAELVDLAVGRQRIEALNQTLNKVESLKIGGPGGTSGGMDGWQTSVEKRLDEIKVDIRDMRTGIGTLSTQSATLTERVAHLPSKGFIVKATVGALGVMAALVAFQSQIQAFLKIPH